MYKRMMERIKKAENVYICTHTGPDGDAIGSMMALYLSLKNMGINVYAYLENCPEKFKFLEELEECKNCISEPIDVLICTDSSSYDRFTIPKTFFDKAKEVICFDHHKFNEIQANLKVVDDECASACELIYEFLKENEITITSRIADFLYLGIMTDTGSFNYPRTTPKTHEIVADLIRCGADFTSICKKVNDTWKMEKMNLLGYIINNIESFYDGRFKFAFVSKEWLKKYNISKEDLDGMVNYLRMIEGTVFAAYVYIKDEDTDTYKVSLRTNGNTDCSLVARRFNGGGHINAAGFDTCNIAEDKEKLIQYVGEVLNGENNRDS